jgi:hypothetical protein
MIPKPCTLNQAINKSLSALSDVFVALSRKSAHIPYRNSKLTHFLQPCLSGEGSCSYSRSVCFRFWGSGIDGVFPGKVREPTLFLSIFSLRI